MIQFSKIQLSEFRAYNITKITYVVKKTQWIGINQIIEDLAFEASVAMFIGLIEDLQVQGQQGQHLTFHI
ncbi:hypothetical protein M8J77_022315 [Diaphorina citri]|nr:hypothetical protein M8J77_011587 [Diaphorina citri]KAI5756126.1 hypothetical protein M8J77_022315 [Diaphorina citri]